MQTKFKLTQRIVDGLAAKPDKYDMNDGELRGLCVRVQPSGSKTFYVRYHAPGGQRRWHKLGDAAAVSVEQAKALAKKVIGAVADGADPQAEKRKAAADSLTLGGFIAAHYEPWVLSARRNGKQSVARIRRPFATLLDKKLTAITAWDIEKLRNGWVKSTGVKSRGSRDIAALKGALSRAVQWKLLPVNPLASVKLTKSDTGARIRVLSADEETRLMAALNAREDAMRKAAAAHNLWCRSRHLPERPESGDYLKPLVILLLNTGLRKGEALSLPWTDLDFANRVLTVRAENAKSGKSRQVPLNDAAMAALSAWGAQSGGKALVFPAAHGGRNANIHQAWARLMASASIKDVTPHCLRHTFASRILAAGADINTVKELLGHSSLAITQVYVHSNDALKASAVALLAAVTADNVLDFAAARQ